jgi:DNA mismatch endonuclease (patch repair protein)
MKATPQRDTLAELAIRSELHHLGLRFRLQRCVIPNSRRRVDIAFPRQRVAIFIDGCFWHGCPEHGTWPKANADWWRQKIQRNKERDADSGRRLAAEGWHVIRIWEHENPSVAASRIAEAVRERGALAG